ncbi:copper homeostasis protein CutC [Flectobacillus rivi]|jgi:copper homeostasis protein|uniref:PF03932 family protein CutC n=1 Tax=Flectobacillus rivi TaxID=2984209 RepID=A0ABT6Z8S6_9BACT|nr:copper homeostasis protein CutC [Flectobacillus rivi]MDI9877527.1 copper homeostasis protein CutC [Flectobacillus rivi]
MKIEICAYSLESCIAAEQGGANRIELCASPYEGGTTPSAGLIQLAKQHTSIEVHVMIRPRGSDFCYSALEIEQMKQDMLSAKQLGADGFVLGILEKNGRVNVEQTKAFVEIAHPLPVTFHRAIDMTPDYLQALEDIIEAGCKRILTSGQKNLAEEGADNLKALIEQANGRIEVMIGSGVNVRNALKLAELKPNALHFTGKSTRDSEMEYRKEDIVMGGLSEVPEYGVMYSNVEKIRAVVALFKSA